MNDRIPPKCSRHCRCQVGKKERATALVCLKIYETIGLSLTFQSIILENLSLLKPMGHGTPSLSSCEGMEELLWGIARRRSKQSYVVAATRIIDLSETICSQYFLIFKHMYLKMLESNRFDIVTSSKRAINGKLLPVFGDVTNLVQFKAMVSVQSHKTVVCQDSEPHGPTHLGCMPNRPH